MPQSARAWGSILAAAALAVVLAPSALGAGTVVKAGGTITWTGDSGVNNVTLTHAAGVYTFTRGGSDTMTTSAPCSGTTVVTCPDSGPVVTAITLTALGGADLVTADSTTTIPITILGGDGDDLLTGGGGNDRIADTSWFPDTGGGCSPGTDVLNGGGGNDLLSGCAGNDTFTGGSGDDTMRDQSSLGGTDSFSGGAGSDYADTRDGLAESVACGSETDRVRVDPGDTVNADCELRAPFQTAPMTLSGTVREGETLTAAPGTWTGVGPVLFTYTWCRWPTLAFFCTEIAGATAATYTLVAADVDAEVGATVMATNGAGSELAQTYTVTVVPAAPISLAPPLVTGVLKPGRTLTATNGTWAVMARPIAFFGYQWQRCPRSVGTCTDVPGATGSTHVLGSADQGRRLRVYVVASNTIGSRASFSAQTAVFDMRPPNTQLTSGPAGRTLSRTATFRFTSTERHSTFRCRLDGGPWRSCRPGLRYQGLTLGAHTFRVKARDAAGNLDPTPAKRTWRVV